MRTVRQIGRGGFGNVDLVEDDRGYQYARKTFSVNQPGNFPHDLVENVKKRFIREADVQANLTHANIMPVLQKDLGSDPPSFIMPLAESSLDKDIALDRTLNGYAISAVMDILAGLEELHSMGITHRDLKPQNVLRLASPEGPRYVISDFGLMSIKDTQLSVLTQTGMRMGSDFYTAPEIVADLRRASASSDIYSVGCILHDLFGTVQRIPCNEINDTGYYADIIRSCTRRDPIRRFRSVADLRDALLSLGHAGITALEPQVTDFINVLLSSNLIDPVTWGRIIDKVEVLYPSQDAWALLSQVSLHRIHELIAVSPALAARFGTLYSRWVADSAFDFSECDGIANRLEAFMSVDDINCQAEVVLALLLMGTSHNRWYVERKFVSLCGPFMATGLAKRIAMEIRVMSQNACHAFSHLQRSIGVSWTSFHPEIYSTLNQVC